MEADRRGHTSNGNDLGCVGPPPQVGDCPTRNTGQGAIPKRTEATNHQSIPKRAEAANHQRVTLNKNTGPATYFFTGPMANSHADGAESQRPGSKQKATCPQRKSEPVPRQLAMSAPERALVSAPDVATCEPEVWTPQRTAFMPERLTMAVPQRVSVPDKSGYLVPNRLTMASQRCSIPEATGLATSAPVEKMAVATAVSEDGDLAEKVRTTLLGTWNNMKYSLTSKLRTNFSKSMPVWLLGELYQHPYGGQDEEDPDNDSVRAWIEAFKLDFATRLWLTYRKEFPVLMGRDSTQYITDCGWGCMLRSGQMMLAQALVCHLLGRHWRWKEGGQGPEERRHRQIVRWFADDPSPACPFSLHQLVAMGEETGKKAGDWYGPASVAHLMRQAMEKASQEQVALRDICIYVAQDCTVYLGDVADLCEKRPEGLQESGESIGWKSVIIFIPVRLGMGKLNPEYSKAIMNLLVLKECLGIIGGKPKHSLYFVGYQDKKLIHLDPHYCHEVVQTDQSDFPLSSFHCRSPRKLDIHKMDPSCCIGFYCRTRSDLNGLVDYILNQREECPLFAFDFGHNLYLYSQPEEREETVSNTANDSDYESEEFVILQ